MKGIPKPVAVAAMMMACFPFAPAKGQCLELQRLTHPEPASTYSFGTSVSVSGESALVGVPYAACSDGVNCGSAFLYTFDGAKWVEQQQLTASDGPVHSSFGWSVSLSGDVAVVGAMTYDCPTGAPACGSAYVFRFDGTTWVEQQKLTASDFAEEDRFGASVSTDGTTVAVGATLDDCGVGIHCGAVYIFRYDGTTWVEQQKLTAFDTRANDFFGHDVAVSGNVVVVGVGSGNRPSDGYAGAAYVFRYFNNATWVPEQKLTASDATPFDKFGRAVSLNGDKIVVGAELGDSESCADCGSAYLFRFDGSSWVEQQVLVASDPQPLDTFGSSVSVHETTVIVGAPSYGCTGKQTDCCIASEVPGCSDANIEKCVCEVHSDCCTKKWDQNCVDLVISMECASCDYTCGSAYVYKYNGSFWTERQILIDSSIDVDSAFGHSVAHSGNTVLVGAPEADVNRAVEQAGAAYVFDISNALTLGPVDPDCDGDVDLNDFSSFQAQFSGDPYDLVSFLLELTGPR